MSTLDILGTYYQVEQRGQATKIESLPPARPQRSWNMRWCYYMGNVLIYLGKKLKGESEQSLKWTSSRAPTTQSSK